MTQRQDGNSGVTENVFPDALYRLDHTVGDSSTEMSYDAMGRISAWGASGQLSNVNDYTTPQSGCTYYADHAQPHAVRVSTNEGSSFSPNAFCYDANGNMLSQTNPRGSTTVVWTAFNQPSLINGPVGVRFRREPFALLAEELATEPIELMFQRVIFSTSERRTLISSAALKAPSSVRAMSRRMPRFACCLKHYRTKQYDSR